jgi:two-component system alkaline phosphatase synthesis response regulator PhoP
MIYILEDDTSIRELEVYALESAGLKSRGFAEVEDFFNAVRENAPALVILDLMLPGGADGLEVMKKLKECSPRTFVIIASAKGSEFDRVKGLDLGADDYLAKPFSMMELISRVKAILRRSAATESEKLVFGDIVLDKLEHMVTVSGRNIELTKKEFALLEIFLSSPKRVFSRDLLLERVWGGSVLETRTVDMHIASLRAKLDRVDTIETVRGGGYKLGFRYDS